MNYLLPERLDRLAREYALGTLTGRARRRFESVVRHTPAAARAVTAWQERFSVLAASVPVMQPRDAVWDGLEQRLFSTSTKPAALNPLQWLWNLLSIRTVGSALAGILLCVVVLRSQPGLIGLESPSESLPASYVGLLLDSKGKPTILANSRRHGKLLTVKVLQPVKVPLGKVAQLWAFPNNGEPFPVSVLPGLPAPRESVTVTLPDTSEKLFFNVGRLAISLEAAPAKAGDKPAGEFLLSGHCVKLW
ncbi:MAG: anti-sigma factor [Burkholderiales bacterium]|jgi:anti-sigma-K factor RskA|nr:anti-sigma factor [Burkholderiales bacterium]